MLLAHPPVVAWSGRCSTTKLFNNLQPIGVGAGGSRCLRVRVFGGSWGLWGCGVNEYSLVLTLRCKCGVRDFGPGPCDGRLWGFRPLEATSFRLSEALIEIELKSLILAQIERWRHALHMQVERAGGNSSQWRTGE